MNPGYDFPPTPVLQCTVTRENFVAALRILSTDGMVTNSEKNQGIRKTKLFGYLWKLKLKNSPLKNSIKWKIMDRGRHFCH